MLDNYYARVCGCTHLSSQCISDSPFHGKCSDCNQHYKSPLVSSDDSRIKPETIINAAEAELENANYHSLGKLPDVLWKRLSPLVPSRLHRDLAWAIAASMP